EGMVSSSRPSFPRPERGRRGVLSLATQGSFCPFFSFFSWMIPSENPTSHLDRYLGITVKEQKASSRLSRAPLIHPPSSSIPACNNAAEARLVRQPLIANQPTQQNRLPHPRLACPGSRFSAAGNP